MSPDQRARALRLADGLSSPMGEPGVTGWATMMDAANLLRELAAEPEPERVPMTGDEISAMWSDNAKHGNSVYSFVRQVEAHHGIV